MDWISDEVGKQYGYHDTTAPESEDPLYEAPYFGYLPSEALKINGQYIEEQIDGYRTLYVSGRELLEQEITSTELTRQSGTRYRSRRYPERVITVGFQIIPTGDDYYDGKNEEFREAFNKLAGILNVENAELIFHDEEDKFFIGTPSGVGDIEPGKNAVTGEFEITCNDPFKYSIYERIAYPTEDDGKTFLVPYNGTAPSFPTLEVDFPNEDESSEDGESDVELTGAGDCGFVAFVDSDGHILQFGDPEEVDGEVVPKSQTLVNQSFKKSTSWGSSAQRKWPRNTGVTTSSSVTHTGTVKEAKSVTTDPNYYLTANSFGTGTSWHGPSITRTIPADAAGETGAVNCKMTCKVKVCIGDGKSDGNQIGSLQALLVSGSGSSRKIVAGVAIVKNKTGKKGFLRFYVNGSKKQDVEIDLSYHNKRFGTNRAKSKGVTAIDTIKTITIKKTGNKVEFDAGGVKKTFKDNGIKNLAVTQVTYVFLQYGTKTPLACNGLYSAKFVKNKCSTWKDVPNKFSAGDVLVADCNSGTVTLNDVEEPDLGAPGNDWERFFLTPGTNQITTAFSDFVAEGYEPTFKLRFREVFL